MRKYIAIFALLLTAGCLEAQAETIPIRILPLGDSITHGYWSNIGTNAYNSYRKELKALLEAAGYDTDFVGSLTDGDFADPQHEGHDGWHADKSGTNDILGQVTAWMAATDADVILLHIGTNDILADGANASEVSDILDQIFIVNSNATVVLALIINADPNAFTWSSDVTTYNSNLNAMAQARIIGGDDIIVVDMENGAGIDYVSSDMIGFHPSQAGYDKMATNWYPSAVIAINRQLALQAPSPHIDSITVTNDSVLLDLGNLTPGRLLHVEQTETLIPAAWTNTGTLVPLDSTTSWTNQATPESSTFYRLVLP